MAISYLWNANWVGVYRASNSEYVHGGTPIRTAGSTGYNSYVGIPYSSILSYMNSSKITPRVYLNIYITDAGDFDVGMHQETGNKASNGFPYYQYTGWSFPGLTVGWKRLELTNITMTGTGETTFRDALVNGYKGLVLYGGLGAEYGEAYGVTGNSYNAYIEVVGEWNTSPGKPSILAPTAGQQVEGQFELKASAAIDPDQTSSQLKYEWAINDGGLTWYYTGLGAYGQTNRVVDFGQYNETNNAQVGVRAYDGLNYGDWSYSPIFSIVKNHPPDPPTLISPVGGVQVDVSQDTIFTWKHNDAGTQSAYDFRWREQGTTTWIETNRTSTNQSHMVAANTFPLGATIEWTVRTYDEENLIGAYATNGIFEVTAPSGAPTITDPINGAVISTSRVVVSWSAPDQDSYEMQLVELTNDGTTQTVLWTEVINLTEKTKEVPWDLVTGKSYEIYIRVDTVEGLWSNWAKVQFTTAFTPPTIPVLTTLPNNNDGSITLTVQNPVSGIVGEPNVTKNEIFRREYSSNEEFIRIADNLGVNGTFTDYTPASGVTYEYLVRTYGDNGTNSSSQTRTDMVMIKDSFFTLASNPANFVRLRWNPSRKSSYGKDRTLLQFNGREYAVAEFGESSTKSYSLSFDIRDDFTFQVFMDLMARKETLLYRDGRGRRDFVTVESIDIDDKQPDGYSVSFSVDKVYYKEEV